MTAPQQEKTPVFSSWDGWYRLVLAVFVLMVVLMALIMHWMA